MLSQVWWQYRQGFGEWEPTAIGQAWNTFVFAHLDYLHKHKNGGFRTAMYPSTTRLSE